MATNKHAMIRYQALDACFANRYKRFYIEDLIEACNKALKEFYISKEDPINDVEYYVKKRTIFNDIAFMQSAEGWNAPIKRYYVGRRCYYRYEDEGFSINKKDFSEAELDKIDEALIMPTGSTVLPVLTGLVSSSRISRISWVARGTPPRSSGMRKIPS